MRLLRGTVPQMRHNPSTLSKGWGTQLHVLKGHWGTSSWEGVHPRDSVYLLWAIVWDHL